MDVVIINALLTRRCNLRCSYCRIYKNYSPEVAPAFEDEIGVGGWKEAFRHLRQLYPSAFFCIFGGEPTLVGTWEEFLSLVSFLTDLGGETEGGPAHYSICSNSVILTEERARQLVDAGLLSWTASVDSLSDVFDASVSAKSRKGAYWLRRFKELGLPDAQATVVLHKHNYRELPEIVKVMTHWGVWVEPTTLDWSLGEHYDFAEPLNEMAASDLLLTPEDEGDWREIERELKEMLRGGRYLLYTTEEFIDTAFHMMRGGVVRCAEMGLQPWNFLCVDADGKLRLCYRIRGRHTPKFSVFDIPGREGEIQEAMLRDRDELCHGCRWECLFPAKEAFKRRGFLSRSPSAWGRE